MRRLIVKMSSIGDVIHTIPAVRSLRASAPGDYLAWIVEEAAYPIVAEVPEVDRVIRFPRSDWGGIGRCIRDLRGMRFQQVIDFQGLLRSALVAALSGARERVGYREAREGSPLLYHRRVPAAWEGRHAIDRYLDLARALGGEGNGMDRPLRIPSRSKASLKEALEASGVRDPFVCLHPSAGRRTNRYPPESFGRVGDGIVGNPGMQVVLTGSLSDVPLCGRVAASMDRRPVDLSGRLDLWELAAVAASSRLFIAGDTGPLHLAVAVGARVVGIYGGAPVERTGPYGQAANVVRSPHPCGRCYRRSCPDLPCMAAIPPEAVLERARQVLEVGG